MMIFPVAILILAGAVWLWWRREQPYPIRNILLISLDTCRADHLGCYGFSGDTTPTIDGMAQKSVLFTNAASSAPMTLPAHSTMLTGTNPPYHGVHDNLNHQLDDDANVTLAEILKQRDFTTGAIVSTFVLDSKFGLDQGFDSYNDDFQQQHKVKHYIERKGDVSTQLALDWLEQHQDERFFLFLHYYDPHDPYVPPEPFATRFADNRYAGEIAFTDHCIGQVIEKLKSLGLYDSTLIVIAGDHGEMLGEHGERSHAYFIYQSVIRVPLLFKLPGQDTAFRIDEQVGLVDIVPTVCSLLDIEPPPHARGEDLSSCFRRGKLPRRRRHRYCESVTPTRYGANTLLGVVDGRWKYISTTRPELYDLVDDPLETNNLALNMPDKARGLHEKLDSIVQSELRENVANEIGLDAEELRKLESLGYVGGGTAGRDENYDQPEDRAEPKDLIAFHEKYTSVTGLRNAEKLDRARSLCEQLVTEHPEIAVAHMELARIAGKQDDDATAMAQLERVIELDEEHANAHVLLGALLKNQGRHEVAVQHFQRALHIEPAIAQAHSELGIALAALGRSEEAMQHYELALELDSELPDPHVNLGLALADAGQTDEAVRHYRQALEANPEHTDAHYNLARAMEALGNPEEAIRHYGKVLELDGDYAEAHLNLGGLLARRGDMAGCLHHFHESLRIRPDHALGHYNLARALQAQERLDEAMTHYRRAVELDPEDARAHYRFAQALLVRDELPEAVGQYRAALRVRPNWPAALSELAWCLASQPNSSVYSPPEAIELARRAAKLSNHQDPWVLDRLAIALAADGQLDSAVATARQAMTLASAAGEHELLEQIRERLQSYQQPKR